MIQKLRQTLESDAVFLFCQGTQYEQVLCLRKLQTASLTGPTQSATAKNVTSLFFEMLVRMISSFAQEQRIPDKCKQITDKKSAKR